MGPRRAEEKVGKVLQSITPLRGRGAVEKLFQTRRLLRQSAWPKEEALCGPPVLGSTRSLPDEAHKRRC